MSVVDIVILLLRGLVYLIIADAILSWVQGPEAFPRTLTRKLTEPLYVPIHAILNPKMTGGLDLSPIILIFGLEALSRALRGMAAGI